MHAPPERRFTPVLCLVGASRLSLWSLTPAERLIRQFAREGITTTISPADAPGHNGPIIFVRADAVIDQPLIPVLIKRPNLLLVGDSDDGRDLSAGVNRDAIGAVIAEIGRAHV